MTGFGTKKTFGAYERRIVDGGMRRDRNMGT